MVRPRGEATMTRYPARPSDRVTARDARCSPSVTRTVAEEGIVESLIGLDHRSAVEPGTDRPWPRLGETIPQLGLVAKTTHRRGECGRIIGRNEEPGDTLLENLFGPTGAGCHDRDP